MTQDEQGRGFRSLVEQIQARDEDVVRDPRDRAAAPRRRRVIGRPADEPTGTASAEAKAPVRLLQRRWL